MGDPVVKYGATWGGINPLTGQVYKWGDPVYYDSPIAPSPTPVEIMNTPLIHVSTAFARLKNAPLEDFASNVSTRMLANATIFTNAPAALAALSPAVAVYHTAVIAADDGGHQLTTDKLAKGQIVIGLLRTLAAYVQAIPNITLANAQLSGFVVTASGKHAPVTLTVPAILAITNVNSGQLGFKIKGSRGAKGFEFCYTVGTGKPVKCGTFTSTRNIVVIDLVPGTVYSFQVRAFAGNNQFSAWSEAVTHMAT